MNTIEIPVLLLTGYLGSGKTTLVNHILSNTSGIKFAVISNGTAVLGLGDIGALSGKPVMEGKGLLFKIRCV